MEEGKYIYCVIKEGKSCSFGPLGIGGRGDEVYAICLNGIAAVVSNALIKNYSVSRENMLAHERAIETVMKEYAVLPVRFATIAKDEDKIKKILEKEHGKFENLLDEIKDKKELGVKAIFKQDLIYKEILEKYKDIKRLKEKIAVFPPEKTYPQRMEIGKMVEQALEEEKEIHKEEILNILSPLADEIKINDTYGEKMIINAAFLVDKNKEAEFDRKVNMLDEKYEHIIKFKYVGTLPPFNFVNLAIETGNY